MAVSGTAWGQTAVHDTSTAFDDGYIYASDSLYSVARGATTGDGAQSTYLWFGQYDDFGGDSLIVRAFLTFGFGDIPGGAIIDSAKIIFDGRTPNYGTHFWYNIYVATYSSIVTSEFNAFIGWQSGMQTYTGDSLAISLYSGDYSADDNVMYMRQSGLDSITAHIGDSLKLVILSREDVTADTPTNEEKIQFEDSAKIIVSYHTGSGDSPRTLTNFDVYAAGQDTALYTVHADTGDFSMWDSIIVYDATDTATVYGVFTSGSLADTAGTLSNLTINTLDTLIAVMYAPVDTIVYSLTDTITTLSAPSQNYHYVRAGATGNNDGTDWTNAWTELPATLIRGDTYYIADSTYSEYTFDDAEDDSTYIYIKKATESAHGTDTGWDSSYGDGQAIFTEQINFLNGYYIWDGVTGSGSDTTSYGFKVTWDGDTTVEHYLVGMPGMGYGTSQVDHITFSHTSLACPGEAASNGGALANMSIYSAPRNAGYAAEQITISNNYLAFGSSNMLIRFWRNCIIEGNYFDANWSSSQNHGQAISSGTDSTVILRNNTFKDPLVFILGGHNQENYNWNIYNNLVIGGDLTAGFGLAESYRTDAFRNCDMYHNTFIGVDFGGRGALFVGTLSDTTNATSRAYNNLFYNCIHPRLDNADATGDPAIYHDYNIYYNCTGNFYPDSNDVVTTGDPFIDSANDDFRLKQATAAGVPLSSPYNVDILGNVRGADGFWDRGAYEYTAGGFNVSNVTVSDTTYRSAIISFDTAATTGLDSFVVISASDSSELENFWHSTSGMLDSAKTLTKDSLYNYRIVAYYDGVDTFYTGPLSFTTLDDRYVNNLRLTDIGLTSCTAEWDTSYGAVKTAFDSMRAINDADSTLLKMFGTDTTGVIDNLTPETTYWIRIVGYASDTLYYSNKGKIRTLGNVLYRGKPSGWNGKKRHGWNRGGG